MTDEQKRISEVAPDPQAELEYKRIRDIADKDVELIDVTFTEGDFGEYAVMTVVDLESQQPFFVTTGAKPVMRQLKLSDVENDLPLLIRAERVGRTWRLV